MRMTAYLLAALPVLAASGCSASPAADAGAVPPELKLEGVRFRVYRGDVLRSVGEAATASLRRDSSELKVRDIRAVLPRSPAPVRLSAPEGEGSLDSRTFEATGGVLVARGEDEARTERAEYLPEGKDGVLRGDDPIVVSGRGYRLDGTGFTLDLGAGTIVVRGGARLLAGVPGAR